jgi:putative membrane protein
MMGNWGNGSYGGGYGWMGIILPMIIGIGIILLVYFLFKRNSSQNSELDILRKRYAHGEIDSTEYMSRKLDLEGK